MIAVSNGVDPEHVADWADRLIESIDVTGEVLRIGPDHIGKALP